MSAFHREMVLRRDDEIALTGIRHFRAGVEPRRARCPKAEDVVTDVRPDSARAPAAETKVHDNRVVGRSRHDPDRHPGASALIFDLEQILVAIAGSGWTD